MQRREFLKTAGAVVAVGGASTSNMPAAAEAATDRRTCDTFVYGSTPGGIAAAVEAARRGERVVLACPKNNPGGMAASGLCTTDAVRRNLFGGLMLEFIEGVRQRYRQILGDNPEQIKLTRDGWFYEPSVAEHVFRKMLAAEERLEWLPGLWLTKADVADSRVTKVELEDAKGGKTEVAARTFIDGTYEGDLAARANVPYRVGREGRDEYGESKAGIHYMNWRTGEQILTADTGEPSLAIQAFCARSIFTDDTEHFVPIEKPATYEEHLPDYLPLIEDYNAGRKRSFGYGTAITRRKFQMNGSITDLTSLNCPGMNWGYPEADRHHRERLDQFHVDHAAGMIWFLQNDLRMPETVREKMKRIGLHDEEFVDNNHWPWQIYVRQGRRIEGRAIVTQHNFIVDEKTGRTPKVEHPIALGEHSFDVHPCHDRRFLVEGYMEGVLWYPKKAEGPAQPGQIPYGCMLPKQLDNLLVPVAMSSTHVAMSVLRMEPVWMTTGQVAGLAAAEAREKSCQVAQLDPTSLPKTLGILTEPSG